MTFAKRLRDKRCELGMTQAELAAAADITMRSVQNYESGKRYPGNIETAAKLAAALGTTTEYLLGEGRELFSGSSGDGAICDSASARREMKALVAQMTGLFAGGELAEEDRDLAMKALTDAYFIAKEEAKKYAGKKK
jgi:transcriptional regulator with XRE-family HTH domain